jgi:hypothetical protein
MVRIQEESNFEFVDDAILRGNLDRIFDHILELLLLSESSSYDPVLKGSFRQTIIIYTASIIEGLLLYALGQKKTEKDCAREKKVFSITKEIYQIDSTHRIVLVEDRVELDVVKFAKINLDQLNKLCKEYDVIENTLYERVDKVRALRNRQHLGSLQDVDSEYSARDLEFVFSVAREVKRIAQDAR